MSGWLVVMPTYLRYYRLSWSHRLRRQRDLFDFFAILLGGRRNLSDAQTLLEDGESSLSFLLQQLRKSPAFQRMSFQHVLLRTNVLTTTLLYLLPPHRSALIHCFATISNFGRAGVNIWGITSLSRGSKFRGRRRSLRPVGCTPALPVTQQRRCSCSLWRYVSVKPLPFSFISRGIDILDKGVKPP